MHTTLAGSVFHVANFPASRLEPMGVETSHTYGAEYAIAEERVGWSGGFALSVGGGENSSVCGRCYLHEMSVWIARVVWVFGRALPFNPPNDLMFTCPALARSGVGDRPPCHASGQTKQHGL